MLFSTIQVLDSLIAAYFTHIAGKYHFEDVPAKGKNADEVTRQKVWDCEPEPPTISELAFYLGFESRAAFEQYELDGEFAPAVKRARLRVEAAYEKKLHQQSPTGAIFALKNLGWGERDKAVSADDLTPPVLKIEIHDNGIPTAGDEREVVL
jgi:hypothetical protein